MIQHAKPRKKAAEPVVSTDSLRRAVEAVLPEVKARAQLLGRVRTALVRGEDADAIELMREYCGLPRAS